jgi:hypothetical protein
MNMPSIAPSVPPSGSPLSSVPPSGNTGSHDRISVGAGEKVEIEVHGIVFEITFSELYATLGLCTAEAQCEFRDKFVGTNMGRPPGVLQHKLGRWRPSLAALLETIPIR